MFCGMGVLTLLVGFLLLFWYYRKRKSRPVKSRPFAEGRRGRTAFFLFLQGDPCFVKGDFPQASPRSGGIPRWRFA